MKLALIPLFLLIFACIFGMAYNYSLAGEDFRDDTFGGRFNSGGISDLNNYTLYEDGEGTELGFETASSSISFSLGGMAIALLVTTLALGAVVGINVLGSGLSQFSVKSIVVISVLMSVWLVFSTFGVSVFNTVPYFGLVLYFVLSLVYTFGVFQECWV